MRAHMYPGDWTEDLRTEPHTQPLCTFLCKHRLGLNCSDWVQKFTLLPQRFRGQDYRCITMPSSLCHAQCRVHSLQRSPVPRLPQGRNTGDTQGLGALCPLTHCQRPTDFLPVITADTTECQVSPAGGFVSHLGCPSILTTTGKLRKEGRRHILRSSKISPGHTEIYLCVF